MKTCFFIAMMQLVFTSCNSQEKKILVDSNSFGKISLGDPFTIIDQHYDNLLLEQNSSEGFTWPLKRFIMNDNNWVAFEDINSDGKIDVIKTNSPRFISEKGLCAGITINDLKQLSVDFEVFSDVGGLEFITSDSDIIFRIDVDSVESFFDNGGEFPENLPLDAQIVEIEIRTTWS